MLIKSIVDKMTANGYEMDRLQKRIEKEVGEMRDLLNNDDLNVTLYVVSRQMPARIETMKWAWDRISSLSGENQMLQGFLDQLERGGADA